MYVLLRLTGREGRVWSDVADLHITLNDILKQYNDSFIDVMNDDTGLPEQYDVLNFTNLNVHAMEFLDEFITTVSSNLGEVSLAPRSLENRKSVVSMDVWDMGLRADRGDINTELGGNPPLEGIFKKDLKLSYPEGHSPINSLGTISSNSVFSVNGYVRRHVDGINGIFIKDVMAELDGSEYRSIRTIDFSALGGYEISNFEDVEVIRIKHGETTIKASVSTGTANKTILVVVDGVLMVLGDNYGVREDGKITLTLDHKSLIRRSNKQASELPWVSGVNIVNRGFDTSTINIPACLSSPNSFMIVLDTDKLSEEKHELGTGGIPGTWTSGIKHRGVGFTSKGLISDYIISKGNYVELEMLTGRVDGRANVADVAHRDAIRLDNGKLATGLTRDTVLIRDLYVL